MKPAQALLSLLTVVGVGHASGQFITSTTTASAVAPRDSDAAATIAARQETDAVRVTVTQTVIQSSRGSSSSRSSTQPRPSSSTKKNDDDDDGDNDTTTRHTSQNRSQTSTAPSIPTNESTSLTDSFTSSPSQTPSETAPPPNTQPSPTGLSPGGAAGIAAAAVSLAAILAAAAFLLWRRRQGGIRGAVVTADYPRGLSEDMSDGEPKLPPGLGLAGQQRQGQQPYPLTAGDVGVMEGVGRGSSAGVSGERLYEYKIPPAGTMPGEEGFGHLQGGEYPHPHHQLQQQQQWLSPTGVRGEDPFTPRPVSAFTAPYPSPGQPVLPVSPMTPYHHPESMILTPLQQHPPRITSYHPHMHGSGSLSSPELPTYLIPGGDRSRAMSFSGVPRFGGGGPHVAELVGSPPVPSIPSMMVVVEGGEPAGRQSHVELS